MSAIRNGAHLDEQVFPDPTWCVPGVIPEGSCILSGHPKIGKSFLVLGIALAAAGGGSVLGVDVQTRPVLYLALEDDSRRLQVRSRQLLGDKQIPERFWYLTAESAENAVSEGVEWVIEHGGHKPLVIVDTLEKVRGDRSANAYADDYKAGGLLRKLLAPGGTVIAVHHNRKGESEDFIDAVSGTLGLVGSVDTVITLNRKRTDKSGTLSVTGRDVDETVYKVAFDDGRWMPDGDDLAEAAKRANEPKLSEKMLAVLDVITKGEATTAPEVTEQLGIPDSTARKYLSRLATQHRLIERSSFGTYSPVTPSQLSQDEYIQAEWTARS